VARPERRVVSADGVELALIEAGDPARSTVVLVHGYPDTKELWHGVIDALEDRFHLVAYDVRGAGASTAPRSRAAYDFERLGDDFEAVVEATAPGKRIHLVGHDWGGLQGWEFATTQRFQGRLASYTAVAGPSLDQVSISSGSLLRRGRLAEAVRRGWRSWYILVLLAPGGPKLMSRVMLAGGGPPGRQPSLARDAVHGANLYRRNIPRRLARPRQNAIATIPVQLIIPNGDRYIPLSYYERAEQHAPDLRRQVVAGSHWLPRTEPQLVADRIGSFIDEVEARD
jgi:pimeloyl-ACP methyl ester carboxylesterase